MSYDFESWSGGQTGAGGRRASERAEILAGLLAPQKRVDPKYLYDARGSLLFEEICRLDEYYPTRTETQILRDNLDAVIDRMPADAAIIELGSGSSLKTRIVLDAWKGIGPYVPVDISRSMLTESKRSLRKRYPHLRIEPVCADYTAELKLPLAQDGQGRLIFFPGSTIGNFEPERAKDFLARLHPLLSSSAGYLLIGVDLVKDRDTLERAYADAQGVTADFNLNLLRRLNREHGSNFALDQFRHRAVWNEELERIEMHLDSLVDQWVSFGGRRIFFGAGESLHTESSYKYTIAGFRRLARSAGFVGVDTFVDRRNLFSVHLLVAAQ